MTFGELIMEILKRIKNDFSIPVFCFYILFIIYSICITIDLPPDRENILSFIFRVGLWLCCSWWLWIDAKINNFKLHSSYGFLFLIFTPIMLPVYIFQSRGWMGFVTLFLYVSIFFFILFTFIIYLYIKSTI